MDHPLEGHPRRAATRSRAEVGDIARAHHARVQASCALNPEQQQVLRALQQCRTASLGGHLDRCNGCSFERPSYNSCRNRHCPKCQALAQHRWLEARRERILATHHFHVVFTLPSELRPLALAHRRRVFDALFRCASQTLLELGRDPKWLGAQLGLTAVLHTWTRDLSFHPHLHCVVTGGGLTTEGTWQSTPRHFLFPVDVLGALFRGKMIDALRRLRARGKLAQAPPDLERTLAILSGKDWVVYAKPPFGDAGQVYAYLGRYTHRTAISNGRILHVDEQRVRFTTRYPRTAELPPEVFLRRLLTHVLPKGFVRIRHYGLLAPGCVNTALPQARRALPPPASAPLPTPTKPRDPQPPAGASESQQLYWQLTGIDLGRCPRCRQRSLRALPLPTPRGPP